jgi:pyruvate,orthophosphate dikinase
MIREWIANSTVDAVVRGESSPNPINLETYEDENGLYLNELHPEIYDILISNKENFEKLLKDCVEFEFVVKDGQFYLLQIRKAVSTDYAKIKISYDLLQEGIIDYISLDEICDKEIEAIPESDIGEPILHGLSVSNNSVSAPLSIGPKEGHISCWKFTTTDDLEGIQSSLGVLTSIGGSTSHAAVICRKIEKSCLVNCGFQIDEENRQIITEDGLRINEGEIITIDGIRNQVYKGRCSLKMMSMLDIFN